MSIDPETRWLTALGATYRGFEAGAQAMPSSLDEARLLDAASRHKAVSLLYHAVPSDLPLPYEELKRLSSSRRAVQSWILNDGSAVLEAFEREGVRALTVKGPALAIQLWGNPHEREFRDMDILVPHKDFYRAVRLMLDLGFVCADYQIRDEDFDSWLRRIVKIRHLAFRKKGLPVYLEIHGRSPSNLGSAPFGFDEAWNTSVVVSGGGYAFRTLEPGRHALYVLIHGAEHSWCQLHWVLDSLAMLTKYEPEVQEQLARPIPASYTFLDPKATAAVFAGLVERLGLGPLPEYLIELKCRKPDAGVLAILAERNFADAGLSLSQIGANRRHRVVFLRGLTRGAYRQYLRSAGDFFLPNDLDLQAFSKWHLPYLAYFFLRPFLFVVRKLKIRLLGKDVNVHL